VTVRTLDPSAALVLCSTVLLATSLGAWDSDRRLYRPLALICVVMAAACLGLAAARPDPLVLGLLFVGLFTIPWRFAVRHRLTDGSGPPSTNADGEIQA
jgi:hypothetical protein